jgi:Cu(I)/Ag(I) efflux system membrane protein CusA/SilA
VRVRYAREQRDDPQKIKQMLVPTPMGEQVPLGQLAEIRYRQGPQAIKSEDTFLIGYVIFDRMDGVAEVDAVENAQNYL